MELVKNFPQIVSNEGWVAYVCVYVWLCSADRDEAQSFFRTSRFEVHFQQFAVGWMEQQLKTLSEHTFQWMLLIFSWKLLEYEADKYLGVRYLRSDFHLRHMWIDIPPIFG